MYISLRTQQATLKFRRILELFLFLRVCLVCRNKNNNKQPSIFIHNSISPSISSYSLMLLSSSWLAEKVFQFFHVRLKCFEFFSLNNTLFFNFWKITSFARGGKSFLKLIYATSNIWFPYLSHPSSTLKSWLIFSRYSFGIYSFLTYQAPKKHMKNHLFSCGKHFLRLSNNYQD